MDHYPDVMSCVSLPEPDTAAATGVLAVETYFEASFASNPSHVHTERRQANPGSDNCSDAYVSLQALNNSMFLPLQRVSHPRILHQLPFERKSRLATFAQSQLSCGDGLRSTQP